MRSLIVLKITKALAVRNQDNYNNLQIDEISDVVDDKYINNEILNLYNSLIKIRDADPKNYLKDKIVKLVHPSIREFFLFRISMNSSLSNQSYENNSYIKIYLRYLNYDSL